MKDYNKKSEKNNYAIYTCIYIVILLFTIFRVNFIACINKTVEKIEI